MINLNSSAQIRFWLTKEVTVMELENETVGRMLIYEGLRTYGGV